MNTRAVRYLKLLRAMGLVDGSSKQWIWEDKMRMLERYSVFWSAMRSGRTYKRIISVEPEHVISDRADAVLVTVDSLVQQTRRIDDGSEWTSFQRLKLVDGDETTSHCRWQDLDPAWKHIAASLPERLLVKLFYNAM
jgi:hypothetical protein